MIEQQIRVSRGEQRHVVVKCEVSAVHPSSCFTHLSCKWLRGGSGEGNFDTASVTFWGVAVNLRLTVQMERESADECTCVCVYVCVILSGLFDSQRGPGVMTDGSAITEAAESMLGSWTLAGWCIYGRAPRY